MQTTIRRNWQKTPRNKRQAWAHMYVSMNPKGYIMLGRQVFQMMGEPEAVASRYKSADDQRRAVTIGEIEERVSNALTSRG